MSKAKNSPENNSEERELLYSLLGELPDPDRPISVLGTSHEEHEYYLLEKLWLDLNGIEPVPAYFIRPKNQSKPLPAILYNHSHGDEYEIGKKEFLEGREYLYDPPYARAIAECGWAGLCIDMWAFGERRQSSELDTFKKMLWHGQVMWGMMVYDSIRALDYLGTRPDVDETRIGTLGMSMGSTMAWWLAALDERIKVTVDICCLTEFSSLIKNEALNEHGIYYFVPGLLNHFTAAKINTLIAPRHHLSVAGLRDPLTPVEGLDTVDKSLSERYRSLGVPDRWRLLRCDTGHEETAQARSKILTFLEKAL